MTKASLDIRIADTFDRMQSSEHIRALLDEVSQAEAKAREVHAEAKQIALDPATRPDALAKARKDMDDNEFASTRMTNASAKLKELLAAAQDREQVERNRAEHAAAKKERDELAAELEREYPALCEKLTSLMERVASSDQRIAKANQLHAGEWLGSAEMTARGAPQNWEVSPDVSFPRLVAMVRLPAFYRGQSHA